MNPDVAKSCALALVPSIVTLMLVQACGGSGNAFADEPADPIEGVWEAVVTQRDCSTNAALATFRGAQVFHRGGSITDTNAAPTMTRGPGFGVWSRSSEGYSVKLRFYRYSADGSPAGSQVVTRNITLAADGNSYTSVNRFTQLDLAGNTIGQGCAADAATRFR